MILQTLAVRMDERCSCVQRRKQSVMNGLVLHARIFESALSKAQEHAYIHTYTLTYIHTYMQTQTHEFFHTYTHACIHMHMSTCARAFRRTSIFLALARHLKRTAVIFKRPSCFFAQSLFFVLFGSIIVFPFKCVFNLWALAAAFQAKQSTQTQASSSTHGFSFSVFDSLCLGCCGARGKRSCSVLQLWPLCCGRKNLHFCAEQNRTTKTNAARLVRWRIQRGKSKPFRALVLTPKP